VLIDDPFRSLADELRRAGGFAKDTTPFSEFLWTDFLRRRVKRLKTGTTPAGQVARLLVFGQYQGLLERVLEVGLNGFALLCERGGDPNLAPAGWREIFGNAHPADMSAWLPRAERFGEFPICCATWAMEGQCVA
jgi:hypothetical protein